MQQMHGLLSGMHAILCYAAAVHGQQDARRRQSDAARTRTRRQRQSQSQSRRRGRGTAQTCPVLSCPVLCRAPCPGRWGGRRRWWWWAGAAPNAATFFSPSVSYKNWNPPPDFLALDTPAPRLKPASARHTTPTRCKISPTLPVTALRKPFGSPSKPTRASCRESQHRGRLPNRHLAPQEPLHCPPAPTVDWHMYSRQRNAFRLDPPPELQSFRSTRKPSSVHHCSHG